MSTSVIWCKYALKNKMFLCLNNENLLSYIGPAYSGFGPPMSENNSATLQPPLFVM